MNFDLEIRKLKLQVETLRRNIEVLEKHNPSLVQGAGSSTDGNIPLFDGTDGKKIKDSGKSLSSYVEGASGSTNGNIPLFDGTSGKKLKDGGIESGQIYKQRYTNISDLDNLTDGGMYRLASVSNGFPGASWSNMFVLRLFDTITQIGFPYDTQNIYFRNSQIGTLASKPWRRVWNDGNLQIRHGTISVDTTWKTFNFTTPMSGVPDVVVTPEGAGSLIVKTRNITASNFQATLVSGTATCHYIAVWGG